MLVLNGVICDLNTSGVLVIVQIRWKSCHFIVKHCTTTLQVCAALTAEESLQQTHRLVTSQRF